MKFDSKSSAQLVNEDLSGLYVGNTWRREGRNELSITIIGLGLILLWDSSGLDLSLAKFFGGYAGFPLRDNWWLSSVLHTGAKQLAVAFAIMLIVSAIWPWGNFRKLARGRRFQLALIPVLSAGLIAALKAGNSTSCPWDLAQFGGDARYVHHWLGWIRSDGGGGKCFPAGHASTGFAFVAGYFALREYSAKFARIWLAAAVLLGLFLGVVQQLRGAHFMSHTLWTGWICWTVAWVTDSLFFRSRPSPMAT